VDDVYTRIDLGVPSAIIGVVLLLIVVVFLAFGRR
jgi:hypothetical protein